MQVEKLKKEYEKSKNADYKVELVQNGEEIIEAFKNNKIFVLKGGLSIFDYILLVVIYGIVVLFILFSFMAPSIAGVALTAAIIFGASGLLFFTKLTRLVVVGPEGVYYKKFGKENSFAWTEITTIKGHNAMQQGMTSMEVKCYVLGGKIHNFASKHFPKKQLAKKNNHQLFYDLFVLYGKSANKAIATGKKFFYSTHI